jgi:hypothetical protein
MTSSHPLLSSLTQPSPSKSNPFARPSVAHSPSSFSRKTLLPTVPSPARPFNPTTPEYKAQLQNGTGSSIERGRSGWRLLWRGGLEIGKDGWRLDGESSVQVLEVVYRTPATKSVLNIRRDVLRSVVLLTTHADRTNSESI